MKKILLAVFFLSFLGITTMAQAPKKPLIDPPVKAKKPNVNTTLGIYSGIKATCTADEGRRLVSLPLLVTDEAKNAYTISSYQLAYKRIGITEDELTGQTTPATTMVAQRFTETPLTEVWQKNISEGLRSGEELYFFDVIVKNKDGRLFFAPELKLTIQ